MSDGHTFPPNAVGGIATRMSGSAADLGSANALRETKHLEPSTVAQLEDTHPHRRVEKNRKFPVPLWPNVGNVDVLVHPGSSSVPLIAIELKWCYVDKLYEAIWDLFKMALLSTTGAHTYLLTGASEAVWKAGVGAELFDDGIHSPENLCSVRLPWGKNLRAWDDLLWGGHDKYPAAVPAQIRTTAAGRAVLDVPDRDWELRAVRVEAVDETMIPFDGGWPFPRPVDAVRPLTEPGATP